jgi:Flp pilus assembly protein TadD
MKPEPWAFVTRLATGRCDREYRRMRWLAAVVFVAMQAGCVHMEASQLFESGTAALDRGEPERAVGDLERAAALTPEVSAIHNHLGIAYERSGRPDAALRAYQRAVDLDCDNQAAQRNLDSLLPSSSKARATNELGGRAAPP